MAIRKGVFKKGSPIEGVDETARKFIQLEKAFGGRGERLEGVLMQIAKRMKTAVSSAAPVGKTGRLKRGVVAKRFSMQLPNRPAVFVAFDYNISPHAHLIEYGHKTIGGGHVPAHPFFGPTISAMRPWALMKMKSEMQTMIRQAAKK